MTPSRDSSATIERARFESHQRSELLPLFSVVNTALFALEIIIERRAEKCRLPIGLSRAAAVIRSLPVKAHG